MRTIRLRISSGVGGRPRRGRRPKARPAAANQFPVPAQDGGLCEQQAADGESAAESHQKQVVGREQFWSLDMTTQDGDLMPEGQQLEIAFGLRLSAEQEYGHQQAGQSLDDARSTSRQDSRDSSPASSRR